MDLNLALIGNCSVSALVDGRANVVWCCMPRFDSAPVFDALLRDGETATSEGVFAIEIENFSRAEQHYRRNTAMLVTRLYDNAGSCIEILDFLPRFRAHGRMFRPTTLVRRVAPVAGSPRIRVHLSPSAVHGGEAVKRTYGSNHIRYVMSDFTLRLTTNASISAVLERTAFVLRREITLLLGPDETLQGSVTDTASSFARETQHYWNEWVRYLAIPFEWQDAVIRAAITLKLNAYDDTGAIVAAVTTSIPEAAHSGRNWDYRFCWLRDAYFVVTALSRLGKTQTMERYLSYIINIIADSTDGELQPVYGITGATDIDETEIAVLPGYRGMGPVRFGNQAYQQVQNDVYGAAILAAAHVFFDQRLDSSGNKALYQRLELLGERAVRCYDKPDAGPWELRGDNHVHTFSSIMCWAACDRLARIADRLELGERVTHWRAHADTMHQHITRAAWNAQLDSFAATFGGSDLDASLLLIPQLGFLQPKDPRFLGTLAAVEKHLRRDGLLFRYVQQDDFGVPETAFTICTFWYIDALAQVGRRQEAHELFEGLLARRNEHGLLSEDIDFKTGEMWGNFPQTYSMVGLINAALRLSRSWEGAF